MSNCYATIHPNDASFAEDFCQSISLCSTILLDCLLLSVVSHFSVACLEPKRVLAAIVLFFNVFSRMPRFLLHFRLFFLTKQCVRGVYVRIEGFAHNFGANLLVKSDTRMGNNQINISINKRSNIIKVNKVKGKVSITDAQ